MSKRLFNNEPITHNFDYAIGRIRASQEALVGSPSVLVTSLPSIRHHFFDLKDQIAHGFSTIHKNLATSIVAGIKSEVNVEKMNFIDLSTILITVPEGFSGNLYAYSDFMKSLYPNMTQKALEYYQTLRLELGKIVNVRSEKMTSRSFENIYEPYKVLREDAIRITKQFFEGDSTQSKSTLGNLFDDKDQIVRTFENVTILRKTIKSTNLQSFVAAIDEVSELLEEIEKQIKLNTDVKFSPQVIQLMSDGVQEAALWGEYLASLFYDCDVLLTISKALSDKLKGIVG